MKHRFCYQKGIACLLAVFLLLSGCTTAQQAVTVASNENVGTAQFEDLGELSADFSSIKPEAEGWYIDWLTEAGLIEDVFSYPSNSEEWNTLFHYGLNYIRECYNLPTETVVYEYMTENATSSTGFFSAVRAFASDCMSFSPYFSESQDDRNVRFEAWALECGGAPTAYAALEGIAIVLHTEEYIALFDPDQYYYDGNDVLNPRYDPERIGKSIDEIDRVYDYDFAQVEYETRKLWGVDRRRTLLSIFNRITVEAANDTERHIAVSKYASGIQIHGTLQASYENGAAVYDPLLILELHEVRCGVIARLAAELFASAGYEFRLVTGSGHTFSEIHYAGDWHIMDPDLLPFGRTILIDGTIPSAVELSKYPNLIDSLGYINAKSFVYYSWLGQSSTSLMTVNVCYPSKAYFERPDSTEGFEMCYKTATVFQSLNYIYGWNYYEIAEDTERMLYDERTYYMPLMPYYTAIECEAGSYRVEWCSLGDMDSKVVAGYRVYVSSTSRGWDWELFSGLEGTEQYRSGKGYEPEMYDMMIEPLPCDLGIIELDAKTTSVSISVPPDETVYVSLIAYDAHGEAVGNTWYPPASEIKLSN